MTIIVLFFFYSNAYLVRSENEGMPCGFQEILAAIFPPRHLYPWHFSQRHFFSTFADGTVRQPQINRISQRPSQCVNVDVNVNGKEASCSSRTIAGTQFHHREQLRLLWKCSTTYVKGRGEFAALLNLCKDLTYSLLYIISLYYSLLDEWRDETVRFENKFKMKEANCSWRWLAWKHFHHGEEEGIYACKHST